MSKTIEVVIQPSGALKIDAVGFQGADCEKATRFLEEALGQVRSRTRKPGHRQHARRQQRIGGEA